MERKILRFLLWTTLIVGGLGGLLRAFVLRPWVVPTDLPELSASIAPSIEAGDVLLLWRLTAPGFGALVVCPDPDDPTQPVVGRILAEAGDQIVVNASVVEVNGERSGSEMGCGEFTVLDPGTDQEITQSCSVETLAGHKHSVGTTGGQKKVPPPVKEELLDGEVYLVSDNRLYPYDSRTYGPLLRSTCQESIVFRLVSARGWGDAERRLSVVR